MATALASRALIEVLRGVLGGNHADLKHQVITARPNSSDRPPLEESSDANPVDLADPTLHDLAGDFLRVRGQVVVRRKRDLARVAEVDDEVSGDWIHRVVLDR